MVDKTNMYEAFVSIDKYLVRNYENLKKKSDTEAYNSWIDESGFQPKDEDVANIFAYIKQKKKFSLKELRSVFTTI